MTLPIVDIDLIPFILRNFFLRRKNTFVCSVQVQSHKKLAQRLVWRTSHTELHEIQSGIPFILDEYMLCLLLWPLRSL